MLGTAQPRGSSSRKGCLQGGLRDEKGAGRRWLGWEGGVCSRQKENHGQSLRERGMEAQ